MGLFGGGQVTDVGEIDGEKISAKEFDAKYQLNIDNYLKRSGQESMDENTKTQLRDQTWNQVLNDFLMAKQYESLGLTVSEDELSDMVFGNNIHPQIRQSFTDPNSGMFDINNVKRYLKQVTEGSDENAEAQWKEFEDYIVTETLQRKFSSLLKKGVYGTSLEARSLYTSRNQSAEINLVAMPYFTIADSTIVADDNDLKSYFKKNLDKYKEKENSRKLEFVVWDFAPTSEDSAVVQKWAFDQFAQFQTADNDTAYVDLNSDVKFDPNPKRRSEYPESVQARLFNDSIGTVIGPLFENGNWTLYKISGIKQDSIFSMKASHILIRVDGPTELDTANAQKKANDILARIKKGEEFATLAAEFGTDGTKDKGGDLGWFTEGSMVKEFNDAVKSHNKGDMFVIKTQFGFHIIKVTGDKSKKTVCAGVLSRAVGASDKTTSLAFNEASQFAAISRNSDDFAKNVDEKTLLKRVAEFVRETDNFLPGYSEAREAVRWAFNAKVGDVSDVLTVGEDKYVILTLTAIREKGKSNFEAARERVLNDFRKDKKAEQMTEKLVKAMESGLTLDAISKGLNQPITPVPSLSFENASIPYIGFDPIFAGAAAGTSELNKVKGPLKGDAAVYAYEVVKIVPAPPVSNYDAQKAEISNSLTQKIEYNYFEVLKEIKNVKDNRHLFY
jgi:peptidyl-prolyl cis-trans isomerase D